VKSYFESIIQRTTALTTSQLALYVMYKAGVNESRIFILFPVLFKYVLKPQVEGNMGKEIGYIIQY